MTPAGGRRREDELPQRRSRRHRRRHARRRAGGATRRGCRPVRRNLCGVQGDARGVRAASASATPRSRNSASSASAIGAALSGLRPIVEVMTVNFSLLALDQIVNTASAMRHMSNGQFSVPVVIRMATGAGRQLAAQHSHSLENWYAHIPGITVLAPATVADAYGMLRTAMADPDPVVIFEHVGLYNTLRGRRGTGAHRYRRGGGATHRSRRHPDRLRRIRAQGAGRRRAAGRGRASIAR